MFKHNTSRYEILTPQGFKPFAGMQRQYRSKTITIKTSHNNTLEGAENHRVLTTRGFITLENVCVGDILITKTRQEIVTERIVNNRPEFVYEPIEVDTHEYITNDIVSHNCEFIGSSNTLIAPSKLLSLAGISPIRNTDDYCVYEDPTLPENKNNIYVLVADTARGVGGDYSAFVVINVSSMPYRVAATYKNNTITPLLYPNIIHQFAKMYNDAYVCVETNDIGGQVADILYRELEYEHIVFTQIRGRKGQQISSGFGGTSMAPGVRTTKQLKRIGCTNLKTLIESDKLVITDIGIINELYTFVEEGESYEAEMGSHDDLVMCCVIFAWLTMQPYFKDWTNTNVRERLYQDNIKLLEEDLVPFAINNGLNEYHDGFMELSSRAFDRWLWNETE